MRIALTGASSTGKTTLAVEFVRRRLLTEDKFCFCPTDARSLLRTLGFRSMDLMTAPELADFQRRYFARKIAVESTCSQSYITDRAFVDVASYWYIRDFSNSGSMISENENKQFMEKCRNKSSSYDLHFYLPWGVIPFEADGYRSEDIAFHESIDRYIVDILVQWKIPFIMLDTPVLEERLSIIEKCIGRKIRNVG